MPSWLDNLYAVNNKDQVPVASLMVIPKSVKPTQEPPTPPQLEQTPEGGKRSASVF